jgi:ABC-type multidrug transport system permease subunit
VIAVATAVLTAVMLLVAWGVGMDMPYPWLLWVFCWLCALSVGIGTIALFAMAGNYGQLIGLLIFVYAGLASAGGTVPVEALPGVLRALSYVEPLRQVLSGTRSILYFNAQGVAGLTRGTVAAAVGLVFWLVVGTAVVQWYDRKGFYRLKPEVLTHVDRAVHEYRAGQAAPGPAPSDAAPESPAPESRAPQPPPGETGPAGPAGRPPPG